MFISYRLPNVWPRKRLREQWRGRKPTRLVIDNLDVVIVTGPFEIESVVFHQARPQATAAHVAGDVAIAGHRAGPDLLRHHTEEPN